jgi:hypothetical protein
MKLRSGTTRMDSSLTKGVLNFPPHYMPKHVSGDTDVDTTVRNIKKLYYTALSPFFLLKNIPFGLGGDWDL